MTGSGPQIFFRNDANCMRTTVSQSGGDRLYGVTKRTQNADTKERGTKTWVLRKSEPFNALTKKYKVMHKANKDENKQ